MNLSDIQKAMFKSSWIEASSIPTPELSIDWKECAGRIAAIIVFYGIFFTIKRKIFPPKRDVAVSVRFTTTSEQCPICFESPRSGVRTGCGHQLCVACFVRYCNGYKNKRPPCPLCRTPLVSVNLTYDQINVSSCERDNSNTLDRALAQCVRKFNASRGLMIESGFLVDNGMIFVKLLLISIAVGVVARFQWLSESDLGRYSSYLVTAFGMIMMRCLWLKCQEQAAFEVDNN